MATAVGGLYFDSVAGPVGRSPRVGRDLRIMEKIGTSLEFVDPPQLLVYYLGCNTVQ